MRTELNELRKNARKAGFLYLSVAIIAPYGLMYVPSKIYESGDTATITNNILQHEFMFRSATVCHLVSMVIMFLTAMALYKLFKNVNSHQAKIMVGLIVLGTPISFLAEVCNITALMALKGNFLNSFETAQVQELARLIIKMGAYGIEMVQVYWGLWLLPMAQLVYRSGFIPRIFAWLLFFNGIAYIVLSFVFILFPEYKNLAWDITLPFVFAGELSFILWLVIKGVKKQALNA